MGDKQQSSAGDQPGKKDGKAPEDYKFWNTQPVPKFKEPNLLQTTDGSPKDPEGAILQDAICRKAAKPEPEGLLTGFEWCEIDVNDESELHELHGLLYNHYVEDDDGSFRLNYSEKYLAWALKVPGWKKLWHVGVRASPKAPEEGKKGKLVAFIAGVPAELEVRSKTGLNVVEINFLTIHRKLRSKRLAPVLIKEITRRCYLNGIYQALYTAGTLLPTPVSTCRYYHRVLDWEYLYKMGFSHLPRGSTPLRQKLKYKVEPKPSTKARLMKMDDVPAVKDLLNRTSKRFDLRKTFSEEEAAHYFCSDASKDVVWSHVVEDDNGKVTDFASYYLLESTVLRGSEKAETIRTAYLYYYASESAFLEQEAYQKRLQLIMHDLLILAKQAKFHVFNALTSADNTLFLEEQKFGPGTATSHFYLFNWRTSKISGGLDKEQMADASKTSGVGIVML